LYSKIPVLHQNIGRKLTHILSLSFSFSFSPSFIFSLHSLQSHVKFRDNATFRDAIVLTRYTRCRNWLDAITARLCQRISTSPNLCNKKLFQVVNQKFHFNIFRFVHNVINRHINHYKSLIIIIYNWWFMMLCIKNKNTKIYHKM